MVNGDEFVPSSHLFFRVRAPRGRANPFAFGGGYSGLDKETMEKIAQVFDWDLMGWSEYEQGGAAKALAYMYDHRKELVAVEHGGFHFLVVKGVEEKAATLWDNIVAGKHTHKKLQPMIMSEDVRGWLDLSNGFFVSKTPEMRDALLALIMSYPDVQT